MSRSTTPPPIAYCGIDPASTTGVCVILPSGSILSGLVSDPLRATNTPIVGDVLLALPAGVHVVAAIERPPAGLRGAAVPRWLGGRYEELLRRAYPRRLTVLNPTPTQCQAAVLGKVPKGTTKTASLAYAGEVLGRAVESHDQADAVALACWARDL